MRNAELGPAASALCEGARCQQEHRNVLARNRVCPVCERGLATDLARLPALYDECGRLLGGSGQRSAAARISGGPLPGLPFNETAADARASIRAVLGSWSGLVAEKRRITAPRRTVADLSRFLARHVAWLAGHEAAAELTYEIARLVGAARRIAQPTTLRRVPVGRCVEAGCTGELIALVKAAEPELPGEISCSLDPAHSWPAREWVRLSRRMDASSADSDAGPTARWLSATEVARLWRVATGTVYRLASEHRWRRRSQSSRIYYDAADVERTFALRAGTLSSGTAYGNGYLFDALNKIA